MHKPIPAYILGTGNHGASNLDLQHEILKQASFAQLQEAGLANNMVVWDIGCGSGAMTEYLAKAVGPEGQVYAMDASAEQIEVVKNRIESAGYKNVIFIVDDVNNLDGSKYKKADLVYSRFLLMHVVHPSKTISLMASLLKPNGVLSLQESSLNSFEANNSDPSMHKYYSLVIEYGKLQKADYTVGRKLPTICEELKIFSKINHYTRDYKTTADMKKLLSQRLDEIQKKLIDSNLITEEEYIKLKIDVSNFLNDDKCNDCIIMPEQSHILAYK